MKIYAHMSLTILYQIASLKIDNLARIYYQNIILKFFVILNFFIIDSRDMNPSREKLNMTVYWPTHGLVPPLSDKLILFSALLFNPRSARREELHNLVNRGH